MQKEEDEPRGRETAPPTETEDLLTRLAGGLAHEIKNPLSTMAINLTLLEEEWSGARGASEEPSPREKRSLKRVRTLQREVVRLEGILDDFLHFTRGGDINRAPADLVALVREVIAFLEPEHDLAEVRVHVDLPTSLPMAMLDEGLFRQALINLMVNARQAMPGGGELIVRLERIGSRAQLSITDTGVGMDEAELERCFELYWSTKKGGTGLGLATVSRIIQLHGGTMHVLSEKGRGTSFTLTLPLLVELARRPGVAPDE